MCNSFPGKKKCFICSWTWFFLYTRHIYILHEPGFSGSTLLISIHTIQNTVSPLQKSWSVWVKKADKYWNNNVRIWNMKIFSSIIGPETSFCLSFAFSLKLPGRSHFPTLSNLFLSCILAVQPHKLEAHYCEIVIISKYYYFIKMEILWREPTWDWGFLGHCNKNKIIWNVQKKKSKHCFKTGTAEVILRVCVQDLHCENICRTFPVLSQKQKAESQWQDVRLGSNRV